MNSSIEENNIQIPSYYIEYHQKISKYIEDSVSIAQAAKKHGLDISEKVESQVGYDLPDRIAKIHEIDISSRLRTLLPELGKELTAFKIAEEIVLGKYGGISIEEKLNNAVRVGLSVVTEGVTVAPLQGIYDVKIKTNANKSEYLSVSFAGPIRSAGGTEAAVTMLIADHVRKIIGLEKYIANSFDDEISRYVEELRIYEREVGNFQFKVSDKDVIHCISCLPVEIDGVDTDPVEVVGHRNLQRVSTNRVRGGALRVMNDGLIGRSRKLLKIVETLKLEGWDWLKTLEGAIQTPDDDTVSHRMTEVITGRPVLSMQKKIGGFRLRYGRSCNTGFATIGIHPTIPVLLNYAIAVGTQIKIDAPGKASTIALVDSIEPPIVKLNDGSVVKVETVSQAISIANKITKILYLGDILISYGDFLENNAQLLPSSYVEEIWALELENKLTNMGSDSYLKIFQSKRLLELIQHPLEKKPSVIEAFRISQFFDIPLYPGYVFYWSALTLDEITDLITKLLENREIIKNTHEEKFFTNDPEVKNFFEKLGIIHSLCLDDSKIRIDDPDQLYILAVLINRCSGYEKKLHKFLESTVPLDSDPNYVKAHILDNISKLLNVKIKEKFSSSIAVRVGRPEKAADRKMKPPVHVLFPIGTNGGPTRDILKALKKPIYIEIANRFCKSCKSPSVAVCCQDCHTNTPIQIMCSTCRYEVNSEEPNVICPVCGNRLKTHSPTSYPLKAAIEKARKRLDIQPAQPLKGVKSLMGKNRCAEPLEKGILRQKHNLYTFKDGTIRFDATNEPLTHFKPRWIKTNITKLRELGYLNDYTGKDLESPDQLLELFIQDIIIPIHAAEHILKIAQFIDEELTRFYGLDAFYKISSIDDLIGHLVIGLAPHTSVGIIGRVIGFVNSQVCLGSPIWHSAKRRDCDGDADSIMLLMDVFLNFSREYLPDRIGGLMDAPLLIQPIVFPHEVQRQAHNIDIDEKYPLDFYISSWNKQKTSNVIDDIDLIKKRLGKRNQFCDYKFTHTTDNIMLEESHSLYSTLSTMEEKLKMQIYTAKLINAVDADEVMSMVLTTHILPDIMGNLRAYSSQSFRCTKCGQKFRRMPLIGRCLDCHNDLLQTVTRGTVEKYVQTALNICSEFKINEYLTSRINTLQTELNLLFKENIKDQHTIIDFI
ncbi:MAG TPA: DNA polymerase II large subunit [Nitrososphaeraceae archaeon]|nr:DNA polymerase II large subunit [Nitrososphaeraceae archaeon]